MELMSLFKIYSCLVSFLVTFPPPVTLSWFYCCFCVTQSFTGHKMVTLDMFLQIGMGWNTARAGWHFLKVSKYSLNWYLNLHTQTHKIIFLSKLGSLPSSGYSILVLPVRPKHSFHRWSAWTKQCLFVFLTDFDFISYKLSAQVTYTSTNRNKWGKTD